MSNNSVGIAVYTEEPTLNVSYSLFWENEDNSMENCPGWGSIWTQLELSPGIGIIYDNPQFLNYNLWDFSLFNSSPCINSGSPELLDSDGTISDIGAVIAVTNCINDGDLNNDNQINILDITLGVCSILDPLNNNCSYECDLDINSDSEYNIVDIILIINIILD